MRNAILYIIRYIAALMLFAACGDSEYEFSRNRCYLVFDNSTHNDPTLASALVPLSPGTFCRIYKKGDKVFSFESNRGLKSTSAANAVDMQRSCILGLYNESGIIVGYGNLSIPTTLYAYDAQCPNCYDRDGMPRHTLTMNDAGTATCKDCKRSYDMNNGGIISKGGEKGDKKLTRYHVMYNESNRVLSVNNRHPIDRKTY